MLSLKKIIYVSLRDFTLMHIVTEYSGTCYNIGDLFQFISYLQFLDSKGTNII